MSLDSLTIKNRLEVFGFPPGKGVIKIPGCEPTTAFSSTALLSNVDCPASVVSVKEVLARIPGTTLISIPNNIKFYLVMPEGPPPDAKCPGKACVDDFYAKLKEIAEELAEEEEETTPVTEECNSFSYNFHCPSGVGDLTGPKFR